MRRAGGFMMAAVVLVLALPQIATAAPAGATFLVSRPDGFGAVPAALDNTSSTPGGLSADGRYAVYTSQADGFAEGIDPFVQSVLLRDTQTGTTTLVSRSDGIDGAGADADASEPAIAVEPNGHVLVAFLSYASNLVDHSSGTMIPAGDEVWLRDVTAGTTTLVSRPDGTAPTPAQGSNEVPAITVSALGPVVAWATNGTNLGADGGGIFIRTVEANDTQLVSCEKNACGGAMPVGEQGVLSRTAIQAVPAATPGSTTCPALGGITQCVLVSFGTTDTTITNEPGGTPHEQVVETVSEMTGADSSVPPPTAFYIVSRPDTATTTYGNGSSSEPSFSADGRDVAFTSDASNLTADAPLPASNPREAYVRDVTSDRTTMLSKGSAPANQAVRTLTLGGNAGSLRAIFNTTATNLGSAPGAQAYLRDVATGTTSLLNRASGATGVGGDGGVADHPAISADGSAALFASGSDNLGDDPGDFFTRVHLRTLPADPNIDAGSVSLISRPSGSAPFTSLTGASVIASSAVSANGRYVAFASQSASLSPNGHGHFFNVFVRDTLAGTTTLVSRATGPSGTAADASSRVDSISDSGRLVAFESSADDLTAGTPMGANEVYVRDLDAQTTTLVSRATGPSGAVASTGAFEGRLSASGNAIAFVTDSTLDPAATSGHEHAYLRDLSTHTTTLVDRDTGSAGAVPAYDSEYAVPDADGGRVAFASAGALDGAPADGKSRIFVRDLRTSTTTLISRAEGSAGAVSDGSSVAPAIDADGNVIAFLSTADNLEGEQPNEQVYVRDVVQRHTQLASRASGATGAVSSGAEEPTIDGAGDRVAFPAVVPGAPASAAFEAVVRDLPSQTSALASLANGASDIQADGRVEEAVIDSSGDCLAFSSAATNLGDGFASADFSAVHLRVLRDECPRPAPAAVLTGGSTATPGGAGTAGGKGATARASVLSRLALKARRFHVGGKAAGTRISFRLSAASSVTLVFARLTPGHLKGRRCVKSARKGRRCEIAREVGSLKVKGKAGANADAFSGRLGRHALPPGSYALTATPLKGVARKVSFTILSRR